MEFDGGPITSVFPPPCGTAPQRLLFAPLALDQTAFLPNSPTVLISQRRQRLRPSKAGGLPVSLMAPGKASTRVAIPRPCPWSSSASPSPPDQKR